MDNPDLFSLVRINLLCPLCSSVNYATIRNLRKTCYLAVRCQTCQGDIVAAVLPDEKLDGAKQDLHLWVVPLHDLIYLDDHSSEEEGDRLRLGKLKRLRLRDVQSEKGESA